MCVWLTQSRTHVPRLLAQCLPPPCGHDQEGRLGVGDLTRPGKYLETHGPVYEVEVQVVQLQGLQSLGAGCPHQGLLMAGTPELQGGGGALTIGHRASVDTASAPGSPREPLKLCPCLPGSAPPHCSLSVLATSLGSGTPNFFQAPVPHTLSHVACLCSSCPLCESHCH